MAPTAAGRRGFRRAGGVLTLLVLAAAAVLWFYVFPWAALRLPVDASGFSG
jgi:hypothetical protein